MSEFDLPQIPRAGTGVSRAKCLQGVTIILVEDSLSASEGVRLMAVASGARLRRADSLENAARHLAIYRPNVVIIDLGLPDGSGLELIDSIRRTAHPCPALIAISGGDPANWTGPALEAGADAVLVKPIEGIHAFQNTILSVLSDGADRAAAGPDEPVEVSRDALRADLDVACTLLADAIRDPGSKGARYSAQFVESLARLLDDTSLADQARRLDIYADGDEDAVRRNAAGLLSRVRAMLPALADDPVRKQPREAG